MAGSEGCLKAVFEILGLLTGFIDQHEGDREIDTRMTPQPVTVQFNPPIDLLQRGQSHAGGRSLSASLKRRDETYVEAVVAFFS